MSLDLPDPRVVAAPTAKENRLKLVDWLERTQAALNSDNAAAIKPNVAELVGLLRTLSMSSPTRAHAIRVAECFANLFAVVGPTHLNSVAGSWLDTLKAKDNQAAADVANKQAAAEIMISLFDKLGRQMYSFVPDVCAVATKQLKAAEPKMRAAFVRLLAAASKAMDHNSQSGLLKDCVRALKSHLADKTADVRLAAVEGFHVVISVCNFIQRTELDSILQALLKSLENGDHTFRTAVAETFSVLCTSALDPQTWQGVKAPRKVTERELFQLLSTSFSKTASLKARTGIVETSVALCTHLGAVWAEKHVSFVVAHAMSLVDNPKAFSSHKEIVHARRCARFVIVRVLGMHLGHRGRTDATKELVGLVKRYVNDASRQQALDNSTVLAISLMSLHDLIHILGSLDEGMLKGTTEAVLSASVHPSTVARLAAGVAGRALAECVPGHAQHLASEALSRAARFKSDINAVHGSSVLAMAVMAGSAGQNSLGLPLSINQQVLSLARELFDMANSRQDEAAATLVWCGWGLVSALVGMGAVAVSARLADIVGLWKASLTAPSKEDAAAKRSGPQTHALFCHIEGAVLCMQQFMKHCHQLFTEDAQSRIHRLLRHALAWAELLPSTARSFTPNIVDAKHRMRQHIFETFVLIPVHVYEQDFPKLLPLAVADITLTDHPTATHACSILRAQRAEDDDVILGSAWHTDDAPVEAFLEAEWNDAQGAIENDEAYLLQPDAHLHLAEPSLPLPAAVQASDAAVRLFATMFPFLASSKHRLQLLSHFTACVKAARNAQRRKAVDTNIVAALLAALSEAAKLKHGMGSDKVVRAVYELLSGFVDNEDAAVRCASARALGKLAQTVNPDFVRLILNGCEKTLQADRAALPRTTLALTLGCVHLGGSAAAVSSSLPTTVGLLHALIGDSNTQVRTWAMHALAITLDASSHDFLPYLDDTLELATKTLLDSNTPKLRRSCGNVVNAAITVLGPELSSKPQLCKALLLLTNALQADESPLVRLSGLHGMQQFIVFSRRDVNVPAYVPRLQELLKSRLLLLRRASAAIIKQLVQRDATILTKFGTDLDKQLFRMLDIDVDKRILEDTRESLTAVLMAVGHESPTHWLQLCHGVIAGNAQKQDGGDKELAHAAEEEADQDNEAEGEDDDDNAVQTMQLAVSERRVLPTRWQTKVFAVQCVRMLISACQKQGDEDNPHVRLEKARKAGGSGDWLVLRLAELIRTAFVASTSTSGQIQQAGLETMQDIINVYKNVVDVDVASRPSILEQYQAQVTSALRPAFQQDGVSPLVRCTAAQVCASWIASGVNKNPVDLKRILGLLVRSLESLDAEPDPHYNERASTMLKLGVCGAWAALTVAAETRGKDFEYLAKAVQPSLERLNQAWHDALHDLAIVLLPPEYATQTPDSGRFFSAGTRTSVRVWYEAAFGQLIHAACLHWADLPEQQHVSSFYLYLGLCTRTMLSQADTDTLVACVDAVTALLRCATQMWTDEPKLLVEILTALGHGISMSQSRREETLVCEKALGLCRAAASSVLPLLDNSSTTSEDMSQACELCAKTAIKAFELLKQSASVTAMSDVFVVLNNLAVLPLNEQHLFRGAMAEICMELLAAPNANSSQVLMGLKEAVTAVAQGGISMDAFKSLAQTLLAKAQSVNDNDVKIRLMKAIVLIAQLKVQVKPDVLLQTAVLLTQCLSSIQDASVLVKAAKLITGLLKCIDVASGYTAAGSMDALCGAVNSILIGTLSLLSEAATEGASSVEERLAAFALLVPCAATSLDYLYTHADVVPGAAEAAQRRQALVAMVVTVLTTLLAPSATGARAAVSKAAFDAINSIGPKFTAEFRAVFAAAPGLQARLQQMVAAQRATQSRQAAPGGRAASGQPRIQLKMDFSAFSSSS